MFALIRPTPHATRLLAALDERIRQAATLLDTAMQWGQPTDGLDELLNHLLLLRRAAPMATPRQVHHLLDRLTQLNHV